MTIYSDAMGNKFLGDCIYATHNISYPSVKFLQARPFSSISQGITDLLTASGLRFRNVLPQSDFDLGADSKSLLTFGTNSDTIDDRYNFQNVGFFQNGGNGGANGTLIQMYNNSGYTLTTNAFSRTNSIFGLSHTGVATSDGGEPFYGLGFLTKAETNTFIQCVGVANAESLCLFFYQHNFSNNTFRTALYYAGTVDEVNSNFNFYSADITTKSIFMCSRSGSFSTSADQLYVGHRIASTGKLCLTTGDAQYPIVCSDSQLPTSQWATDFLVFDNNPTLGNPCIGKARNLLLSTATGLTIGKPVYIRGAAVPDGGSRWYLPVGNFAGKILLMRCYSSVEV